MFSRVRLLLILISTAALLLAHIASAVAAGDPSTLVPGGPSKWADNVPTSANVPASRILVGDVTGDQKSDGVYVLNGAWYAAASTGSSFSPPVKIANTVGSSAPTVGERILIGDVNNDGRGDPIRIVNGVWNMCPETTTSGTNVNCVLTTYSGFGNPGAGVLVKSYVADLNGDTRSDLISSEDGTWRVALKQVNGTYAAPAVWHNWFAGPIFGMNSNVTVADASGDGKPDLVWEFSGEWHVALNSGSGFGSVQTWLGGFPQDGYPSNGKIMLAKVDANASYDALQVNNGEWRVAFSTGSSFNAPVPWNKGFTSPDAGQATYVAADLDNSGAFQQADAISYVNGTWYAAKIASIGEQVKASGSGWSTAGPAGLASEFDSALDTTPSWSYQRSDGLNIGQHPRNPYSSVEGANYEPEQNQFQAGALVQTINKLTTAVNNNSYKTGSINSFGKFSFQYGYVEARISVPVCAGCFPAFWMLPTAGYSSIPTEIDIFEFFPNYLGGVQPQANSHWPTNGLLSRPTTVRSSHPWSTTLSSSYAGSYHTYGLLWTPNDLQFFVDGFASVKYTGAEVPHEAMYLISTLQQAECIPNPSDGLCSGVLYDTPDGTAKMYTDYIRVYK